MQYGFKPGAHQRYPRSWSHSMIKLSLTFAVVFLVATFPATWLLMLFLGNVGLEQVGYWGCLPMGILISSLLGSASSSTY